MARNKLFDTLGKTVNKVNDNIAKMNISGFPRILLLSFVLVFVGMVIVYFIGIIFVFAKNRLPPFAEINSFADHYLTAGVIAAIGILGKALMDKDNDGKPDVWESEDEKDIDKKTNIR